MEGCHIDLSCYEALCTCLGPALMQTDTENNSNSSNPPLPECGECVPDCCYPCDGEDRWCAVTIENDSEWEKFCSILQDPELQSKRFSTKAGRIKNKEELHARIRCWTQNRTAESVEENLQNEGIAAHTVLNAEDLTGDSQLATRNFFLTLKHPVLGEIGTDRSAVWPRQNFGHWQPAPVLGEANYDIFVGLLGMPEVKFRDYIRRGIIA